MGAFSLRSLQFFVSQLLEGSWLETRNPWWEEQGSRDCLINLTQVLPAETEVMRDASRNGSYFEDSKDSESFSGRIS